VKTFSVTRAPRYEGYDSLHGSRRYAPDEFLILVDGCPIGGTYWGEACEGPGTWHSWGPAGLSMGHASREDAEQAQVRAYAVNPDLADRLRADDRREREAEIARQKAESAAQDRQRRLGDDEPGPVVWTLPACHALYAPVEEVRAVSTWLADNGVEDLSGADRSNRHQPTSRPRHPGRAPPAQCRGRSRLLGFSCS
jgi:hypothetical protein